MTATLTRQTAALPGLFPDIGNSLTGGICRPRHRLEIYRSVTQRAGHLLAGPNGVSFARAISRAAIRAYWQELCNAAGCSGRQIRHFEPDLAELEPSVEKEATGIGLAAAALPVDAASYLLSSLYAALLPAEERAKEGMYFTPPALVNRLLDLVTQAGFDWARGSVLDPACGGGAFLSRVAARIADALERKGCGPAQVLEEIAHRLMSIEIDPFAAWMSQVFLDASLLRHAIAGDTELPELVTRADALSFDWHGRGFDLVMGNPPYGRVTLSPAARRRFAASLYGHANTYGVFMHLAATLCAPGGLIGFVTPTSFLGGMYFRNLRSLLHREAPLVSIDFIADRAGVFDDVLQETALAVFERGGKASRVRVSTVCTSAAAGCQVERVGMFAISGKPGEPWILPRDKRQVALIRQLAELPARLGDYGYEVSTGPLVWNRHRRQLLPVQNGGSFPLIWAESVRANGVFTFSSDRRNHLPFIEIGPHQPHLLLRQPCVLVQRTTAKEQDRRLLAAELPASFLRQWRGVVVENHLNVIRPRNGKPAVPLRIMAAMLNSATIDRAFRCINGSVAVSAYELEALPLPPPESFKDLPDRGDAKRLAQEVEAILRTAYGVENDG